ncbi:hypothetical protein Tco_0790163 [Tanacetum coccineum]
MGRSRGQAGEGYTGGGYKLEGVVKDGKESLPVRYRTYTVYSSFLPHVFSILDSSLFRPTTPSPYSVLI